MLDEQLVFNIFTNTGNFEAYLLYKELNSKTSDNKKVSTECVNSFNKSENVFI